ncbi:MAG TPA: HEAT repeat domain-containing protein [Anaerolineaceae bacterium]|nr:HEAT repeat domain-containing protein [Anaerolineaceae bacterium]HPN53315.1 HEAT repeat domain-containing protein [Anaerolineaceae bacterium]
MELYLIAGGVLTLIVIIVITALLVQRPVSIGSLKANGQVDELVEILEDSNTSIQRRWEAADALLELASPDALEGLVSSLNVSPENLQNHLVNLMPLAGEAILPYLQSAFQQDALRPAVIRAMKAVGRPAANALAPYLTSAIPTLRNTALQVLEEMNWPPGANAAGAAYWIAKGQPRKCVDIGAPAVPVLVQALSSDPAHTIEIIETLGQLANPAAIPAMLQAGKDGRVSIAVVRAIARMGQPALPYLFQGLKNHDMDIRTLAASTLDVLQWTPTRDEAGVRYLLAHQAWAQVAQLGKAALGPLSEAAKDPSVQVRRGAIQALGLMGDEAAVEPLIQSLKDSSLEIRQAVVEALSHYPTPRVFKTLIGALIGDLIYPSVMSALISMGKAAIEPLVAALKLPDAKVRGRASEVLAKMGWTPQNEAEVAALAVARRDWSSASQAGETTVDLLIEELKQPQTVLSAAQALAQIGDPRAVIPLLESMTGKHASVQRELAQAVAALGLPALDPLLQGLQDGKYETLPVIQALGLIGDERAAKPLAARLTHEHAWPVREAAAHALGSIGRPAFEPILEILRGPDADAKAAGLALGEIGAPIREDIIKAMRSKEFDAGVMIIALGHIQDPESAEAILSTLYSGRFGTEIRDNAEEALLAIGKPAIQPLINALEKQPADRVYLSGILVRFGSAAVQPVVIAMQRTYNPTFCESLMVILGEIGDPRATNPLLDMIKRTDINRQAVKAAIDAIWRKQHRQQPGQRNPP